MPNGASRSGISSSSPDDHLGHELRCNGPKGIRTVAASDYRLSTNLQSQSKLFSFPTPRKLKREKAC